MDSMSNIRTQKAGRPSVINNDVIQKLEVVLAAGFGVSSACHFSGISTSTFYEHKALDRGFADRMRLAEDWATFRARQTVLQAIDNGDVATARWYLERKARVEFAANKPL